METEKSKESEGFEQSPQNYNVYGSFERNEDVFKGKINIIDQDPSNHSRSYSKKKNSIF